MADNMSSPRYGYKWIEDNEVFPPEVVALIGEDRGDDELLNDVDQAMVDAKDQAQEWLTEAVLRYLERRRAARKAG